MFLGFFCLSVFGLIRCGKSSHNKSFLHWIFTWPMLIEPRPGPKLRSGRHCTAKPLIKAFTAIWRQQQRKQRNNKHFCTSLTWRTFLSRSRLASLRHSQITRFTVSMQRSPLHCARAHKTTMAAAAEQLSTNLSLSLFHLLNKVSRRRRVIEANAESRDPTERAESQMRTERMSWPKIKQQPQQQQVKCQSAR